MNKVIFTMKDGSRKEFDGEKFTDEDMNRIFHKKCAGICCYDCPVYDGVKCKLNNYDPIKVERVIDKCGECVNKMPSIRNMLSCSCCSDYPDLKSNFKPKPKKTKKTFYFGSWKREDSVRETTAMSELEVNIVYRLSSVAKNLDPQFHRIEVEVEDV